MCFCFTWYPCVIPLLQTCSRATCIILVQHVQNHDLQFYPASRSLFSFFSPLFPARLPSWPSSRLKNADSWSVLLGRCKDALLSQPSFRSIHDRRKIIHLPATRSHRSPPPSPSPHFLVAFDSAIFLPQVSGIILRQTFLKHCYSFLDKIRGDLSRYIFIITVSFILSPSFDYFQHHFDYFGRSYPTTWLEGLIVT